MFDYITHHSDTHLMAFPKPNVVFFYKKRFLFSKFLIKLFKSYFNETQLGQTNFDKTNKILFKDAILNKVHVGRSRLIESRLSKFFLFKLQSFKKNCSFK